jgi:hypothetical protein
MYPLQRYPKGPTMSNFERMNLAAKVQQLVDLIVQAQPGKMSFESEEQFLAMLSLGSMPARAPVRQRLTQ